MGHSPICKTRTILTTIALHVPKFHHERICIKISATGENELPFLTKLDNQLIVDLRLHTTDF